MSICRGGPKAPVGTEGTGTRKGEAREHFWKERKTFLRPRTPLLKAKTVQNREALVFSL